MKRIFYIIALISMMSFNDSMKIKIIFFGDSITELGVYKGGYIDQLKNYILNRGRSGDYELIGAGKGGNKIYDLYLRMEEDVLHKNPGIVVIYEGVNDVWHKATLHTGTDLDKYELFYSSIIKKLKASNIDLILVTPACIGEKKDNGNNQDSELNQYCEVIRRLAKQYSCKLIDFRGIMQDYEKINNFQNMDKGLLTVDQVHLSDKGNQILAEALSKALGI